MRFIQWLVNNLFLRCPEGGKIFGNPKHCKLCADSEPNRQTFQPLSYQGLVLMNVTVRTSPEAASFEMNARFGNCADQS